MHKLFRGYALFLALFEAVPVLQLLLSGPLADADFLLLQPASFAVGGDARVLYPMILTMLALVRVAVATTKGEIGGPLRGLAIASHALEVPCLGALFVKNFLPRRHEMPPVAVATQYVVMAFVVANPIVFYLGTRSSKRPKKAAQ
jgi:hypothetical protein